jgi:hypothetical protein
MSTYLFSYASSWDKIKPEIVKLYVNEFFNESTFTGYLTRKQLKDTMMDPELSTPESFMNFAYKDAIKLEVPRYEEMGLDISNLIYNPDYIADIVHQVRLSSDRNYYKNKLGSRLAQFSVVPEVRIIMLGDLSSLGREMGKALNFESSDNFSKFWEYPVESGIHGQSENPQKIKDFYKPAYDAYMKQIGEPGKNLMAFGEKYLPLLNEIAV